MQLSHRKLLLLLLIIASGLQSRAQQVLSLKDCIDYALKNNANVAVKKLEQDNVEQQIINTRSRALPQVNANGNFSDNYKVPQLVLPASTAAALNFPGATDGKPLILPAGTKFTDVITAEATQALFDKTVFDGLKATKAGRQYAALDTKTSEEDVINQVANSYYSILASSEQLKTLDSNIEKIDRLAKATQALFDNGLAKKIDVDRIQVRLINLQTQRDQVTTTSITQINTLKLLMGISIESSFSISTLSFTEIENAANHFTPGLFNVDNRTEIQMLGAQATLLELQKKATQAENYPKLNAFVNYSYNGAGQKFGDMLTGNGTAAYYALGAFGVRLNVPIFSGFSRKARAQINEIQIQENKKQIEYTKIQFAGAWSNATTQLNNSIKGINNQKQNRLLAENVYNATQTNYNLGLASLTDLLDAQTSYLDAQNNYTQSLLNYKQAEVSILRSQGNIRSLIK